MRPLSGVLGTLRTIAFSEVRSEWRSPVVPANAGTQLPLDSGVRLNDANRQSEIVFENRYKTLSTSYPGTSSLIDFSSMANCDNENKK